MRSCLDGTLLRSDVVILRVMQSPKLPQRCRFLVQQTQDGKAVVMVQRGAGQKLADLLNEYVLEVFVTATEKGTTA